MPVSCPVSRADIDAAAARLVGRVRHTPVLRPGPGTFEVAHPLVVKLELLQHTGSFKPRGAFNRVLTAPGVPAAGLIAASGGNHGAAVAFVAAAAGLPVEIFVPEATSPVKVERLRHFGVEPTVAGALYDDAQAACERRAAETGALMVHPYEHPAVVAGQGTVGRELEADAPDLDTVLVAVGGGGLIAGVAAWYDRRVRVVGVEPETSRCLGAALDAGRQVEVEVSGIASDSLGARRVGDLAFTIAGAAVERAVAVPDTAIAAAQRALWSDLRVMAEPGGATALAALLAGAYVPEPDERVGVVVCGANVDPTTV